jgi:hypothetical protein
MSFKEIPFNNGQIETSSITNNKKRVFASRDDWVSHMSLEVKRSLENMEREIAEKIYKSSDRNGKTSTQEESDNDLAKAQAYMYKEYSPSLDQQSEKVSENKINHTLFPEL